VTVPPVASPLPATTIGAENAPPLSPELELPNVVVLVSPLLASALERARENASPELPVTVGVPD